MPRAVHTNLGTRHIKVRSRASQAEVPLSLILPQRSNGVIHWFWFMCISTANTHNAPLGLLHFHSLLRRDSGCINSSWAHKFREPLWKRSSETKGRERHYLSVLFCFAPGSEETAVQTAETTGHGAGASYETGSRSAVYTGLWRAAGSIPSFGLLLPHHVPRRLKGTAAMGKAPCCERSCSNSFAFSVGCRHQAEVSGWVTKSGVMPAKGPGAPGAQPLGTRGTWLNRCASWAVVLQHLYEEQKTAGRHPNYLKCVFIDLFTGLCRTLNV